MDPYNLSHKDGELALPKPFASIARISLMFGPSPIHPLPRMTIDLGNKVQIWAKRDDVSSGLAFGGNKVRKLEYLLAEALDQKCDTLVSIGGVQSNHTRQVAAVAAQQGLKCVLLQKHWAEWSDLGSDKVGNVQLSSLMNARTVVDDSSISAVDLTETSPPARSLLSEIRDQGGKPYYIPAGASDHPLGGLGFARWAFELAQQEDAANVFFDNVIVCAVTGSTFGGMVAGFKLLEKLGRRRRRIIGIEASADPEVTLRQVLKIARNTGSLIGLAEEDIKAEDIELNLDYAGPAYGVPDERTVEAIKYGARMEAFITDPVYEGKTLAAMIDMIKKGQIKGSIMYAHLGGQLALNAYTDMDRVYAA